jgi:hypothetical protein
MFCRTTFWKLDWPFRIDPNRNLFDNYDWSQVNGNGDESKGAQRARQLLEGVWGVLDTQTDRYFYESPWSVGANDEMFHNWSLACYHSFQSLSSQEQFRRPRILRSRVRVPPGFKVLGICTLQCCWWWLNRHYDYCVFSRKINDKIYVYIKEPFRKTLEAAEERNSTQVSALTHQP